MKSHYIKDTVVFEESQQDLVFAMLSEMDTEIDTFLDIGAHTGHWTTHTGSKFQNVIAIEASPENWDALDARILGYDMRSTEVSVFRAAALDKPATIRMKKHFSLSKDPYYGGMRCYVNLEAGEFEVPANTVDHFTESATTVNLIKMDIEGFEPVAWLGMLETVRNSEPAIMVMEIEDRWLGRARRYLKTSVTADRFRKEVCQEGYAAFCHPSKMNDTIFIRNEFQNVSSKFGLVPA